MMNEEKELNRKRLCFLIVLCGAVFLFLIYLVAGILPPIPVDYSGAEVAYSEEDYDISVGAAVPVTLKGQQIETDADGVTVADGNLKITAPGAYVISGVLDDGCIYIAAESGGVVHLILSGADITCSESPPIYVSAADKVIITMSEGTENRVTATVSGGLESAIYSECDLTFNGTGALQVISEHGIAVNCKTNVRIAEGNLDITAKENAIKAKYSVSVKDGILNLTSGADGIRTTGAGRSNGKWVGTVSFEGSTTTIISDGDAVNSDSVICVYDGNINIVSGGGSEEITDSRGSGMGGPPGEQTSSKSSESAKGLKAESGVYILGGTLTIDSADDTVHSDKDVTITSGTLVLLSNDDGIHADSSVSITGGTISIERCTEGIEGHYIVIDAGEINITASDDGTNATSGNNPIASLAKLMETELLGTGGKLIINGGSINVVSSGDGLDSNGSIIQIGGAAIVNCKSNGADGALDFDGTFGMTGGTLAAFGNAGMMIQTTTAEKSTVPCIIIGADIEAGSVVTIADTVGNEILSVTSAAEASCLVLASEDLTEGMEVTAFVDGTEIGSAVLSGEAVQIGTISSSHGGPGGDGPGEHSGNIEGSHEKGSGMERTDGTPPDEEGGNHDGGGPGMGMPMLRMLPVIVIIIAAAVTVLLIIRKRKKRKEQGR